MNIYSILTKYWYGLYTLSGRSYLWPVVRKKHLEKQPYCMACGSKIKPEVHHIIPYHVDPSKELAEDNLITLCDKYCHFVFGHLMDWKSWNPGVSEDAYIFNQKIISRKYK
jgi:hypothetical protein